MPKSLIFQKISLTFLISLVFTLSESSLVAQNQKTLTSCQVRAFVADPDPKGLNLRRSPNSSSSILGKLPLHTPVNVFASRGNWLLISPTPSEPGILPKKGWVFASLLGLYTKGYDSLPIALYDRPAENSRQVGQVSPDTEVALIRCFGTWVLVKKDHLQGWLKPSQQCSSPYTTCP